MNRQTKLFFVILLSIITGWLSLVHLGYSNFQGDEIKALCRPKEGQGLLDFLLSQRKGPVQFLITCLYGLFDPLFSNEFLVRLPFSLASIFSVFVFYKFVNVHFGERIAIYSSLFMATNGIFVAFARIVQYQSITILFSLSSLYFLSLAIKNDKWKIAGLYSGMLSLAVGILAHFDGCFFIPPAIYLLYQWYKISLNLPAPQQQQKHCVASIALFIILLLSFYIPYVLSLTDYQLSYWSGRISGSPSNSINTFEYYNPTIVIYIYAALLLFSLLEIKRNEAFLILGLWLISTFIFMEGVMNAPKTHIYVYLLPLFILIAHGIEAIDMILKRFFSKGSEFAVRVACIVLFLFLFFLSHTIFVDHSPEFPWEDKKFIGWNILGDDEHKSAKMGFPYNRKWREMGAFFLDHKGDGDIPYVTNEKEEIPSFYLPKNLIYFKFKPEMISYMKEGRGFYAIMVEGANTRRRDILDRDISYWKSHLTPVKTFTDKNGKLLSSIYYVTKSDLEPLLERRQ